MADFASAKAKLDRAAEHYGAFQLVLDRYIGSQPVSLVLKQSPDGSGEDFYVSKRDLPPELNMIFGDCVHNLRCVLDHVVMSLAIANGGDPNDRRTAFPAYNTAAEFQQKSQGSLHLLDAAGRAFVESVQPYNRHGRPGTLAELNFLDNRDKHRSVIDHQLEVTAEIQYTEPSVSIEYADPLRLVDGVFYATVRYAPAYTGPRGIFPPIVGVIGVQRSNLIGYLDARGFLRDEAFPYVGAILRNASAQFS